MSLKVANYAAMITTVTQLFADEEVFKRVSSLKSEKNEDFLSCILVVSIHIDTVV